MALFLEEIPQPIQNELRRRQRILSMRKDFAGADRIDEYDRLMYLAGKTPWIRMMSFATPRNIEEEKEKIKAVIDSIKASRDAVGRMVESQNRLLPEEGFSEGAGKKIVEETAPPGVTRRTFTLGAPPVTKSDQPFLGPGVTGKTLEEEMIDARTREAYFRDTTEDDRLQIDSDLELLQSRLANYSKLKQAADLRTKYILYSGTLRKSDFEVSGFFKDVYTQTLHGGLQLRPMPGITEISVSNTGEIGSIRKATINYICWDMQQLEDLEKLYMTPGFGCILEWGWSITDVSIQLTSPDDIVSVFDFDKVRNKVMESKGMYDAMLGIVTNFGWTQRPDGGYDCTTNLTSRGATTVEYDLQQDKMGNPQNTINSFISSQLSTEIKALANSERIELKRTFDGLPLDETSAGRYCGHKAPIKRVFLSEKANAQISDELKAARDERNNIITDLRGYHWTAEAQLIEINKRIAELENAEKAFSVQSYVTWGFFEDRIISDNIKFIPEKSSNPVFLLQSLEINGKDNVGQQYTAESVRISNHPLLVSTNPDVLLIPETVNRDLQASVSALKEFGIDDGYSGYLRNLLINVNAIKNIFEDAITLREALEKILSDISYAAADIWDFKIELYNNGTIVRVIDSNWTKNSVKTLKENKSLLFEFDNQSANTIAREVSLETKIPDTITLTAMYGNSVDLSSLTKFGNEETKSWMSFLPEFADETLKNIIDEHETARRSRADLDEYKMLRSIQNTKYFDRLSDEQIQFLKSILRSSGGDNSDSSDVLLPLEMSIEIDGIGGIEFGHAFTLSYLPERYRNRVAFQTTNVEHSVDTTGWTTTITGVMRLNTIID